MLQVASFKMTGKRIFPHGAAAPSLRAQGLAGAAGDRALLDLTVILVLIGLASLKIR